MIVGVGIDLVDVQRFIQKLDDTPKLVQRLFTPHERDLKPERLAARFAAKEAFVKAMGGSTGFGFQDIEIWGGGNTAPELMLSGGAASAAEERGVGKIWLSIAHDGGFATAIVTLTAKETE